MARPKAEGQRSNLPFEPKIPAVLQPAPAFGPGLFCHSNPIGANPQRKHVGPVSISPVAIHTPPFERPSD